MVGYGKSPRSRSTRPAGRCSGSPVDIWASTPATVEGEAIASPSFAFDPTASPSSRRLSGLPAIGLEELRAFVDGEFVPDAPSFSAEERAAFSAGERSNTMTVRSSEAFDINILLFC